MYTLYPHKSTFQELLKLINKNKMATKKKTTAKPKTYTLTEEQFQQLHELSTGIASIRNELYSVNDEKNLSTVMFTIGRIYTEANSCEDKLDNILGEFEDDSDDLSW